MRRIAIAGALAAAGVRAAAAPVPVDPRDLPAIDVQAGADTTGAPVAVYATGADADLILLALGAADFAAPSGAVQIDGRFEAPAASAFDALAGRVGAVRLPPAAPGARGVDLELHGVPALAVIRELADATATPYVFAPAHALPAITIRAHRADAREAARAVAALAHLELIEAHGAWAVVEPGTQLAPATVADFHAGSRLEIDHAHPGEARRTLEPDEPAARDLCPPDTWVDASLHGQVGVLEAVLDALPGPPCEQHADPTRLDTATAALVGILIEPARRRAVFRVPGGARAFEPGRGERVEVDYVVVHGDHAAFRAPAWQEPSGPLAPDLELRATVRVGARWAALLRSPSGAWRIAREPLVAITPSSASAGAQSFVLER